MCLYPGPKWINKTEKQKQDQRFSLKRLNLRTDEKILSWETNTFSFSQMSSRRKPTADTITWLMTQQNIVPVLRAANGQKHCYCHSFTPTLTLHHLNQIQVESGGGGRHSLVVEASYKWTSFCSELTSDMILQTQAEDLDPDGGWGFKSPENTTLCLAQLYFIRTPQSCSSSSLCSRSMNASWLETRNRPRILLPSPLDPRP